MGKNKYEKLEWDLSSTLYIFQWNYGKIHKVRKTARGGLHSLVYSPQNKFTSVLFHNYFLYTLKTHKTL